MYIEAMEEDKTNEPLSIDTDDTKQAIDVAISPCEMKIIHELSESPFLKSLMGPRSEEEQEILDKVNSLSTDAQMILLIGMRQQAMSRN